MKNVIIRFIIIFIIVFCTIKTLSIIQPKTQFNGSFNTISESIHRITNYIKYSVQPPQSKFSVEDTKKLNLVIISCLINNYFIENDIDKQVESTIKSKPSIPTGIKILNQ